jgi:hypothetical protein
VCPEEVFVAGTISSRPAKFVDIDDLVTKTIDDIDKLLQAKGTISPSSP